MLKLDIGCGTAKRENFVGIDIVAGQGVDVVCDIATERLPFGDACAEHIYSAHCLEHISREKLLHVLQEMNRVTAHGGRIELLHPLVFHSDAFVLGHVNYLSEALYEHIGCVHRDFWAERAFGGARWILEEIRYGVHPRIVDDMKKARMTLEFAMSYLRDVIKEMCVFVTVDREGALQAPANYRRTVYIGREKFVAKLADGPRFE